MLFHGHCDMPSVELGQFLVKMAGQYFGLVLVLQVLAVYEHVVEKPDP